MKHIRLSELDREGGPIFPGLRRQTPWAKFDYWVLEPREMRSVAGTEMPCEQGYVFMAGPVELTVGQRRAESGEGAGFIVEPTGGDHELKNLTEQSVYVLHLRVAMDIEPETQQRLADQFCAAMNADAETQDVLPKVGAFDEQVLKWRDAIHGGRGQIATRHVLSPDDFYSDWTFLDHAILDADSSVGYHYHDFLEESFVVLKGQGLMTIADETFAVGPGSVTWQGIGQGHGIYNLGPEKLEFVRIAVRLAYTTIYLHDTIDLHDDLSVRRPT